MTAGVGGRRGASGGVGAIGNSCRSPAALGTTSFAEARFSKVETVFDETPGSRAISAPHSRRHQHGPLPLAPIGAAGLVGLRQRR